MPIEKNDDAITTKLPTSWKAQFAAIAALEGLSPSEFNRNLISNCLKEKQVVFEALQKVFCDEQEDAA